MDDPPRVAHAAEDAHGLQTRREWRSTQPRLQTRSFLMMYRAAITCASVGNECTERRHTPPTHSSRSARPSKGSTAPHQRARPSRQARGPVSDEDDWEDAALSLNVLGTAAHRRGCAGPLARLPIMLGPSRGVLGHPPMQLKRSAQNPVNFVDEHLNEYYGFRILNCELTILNQFQ